MSDEPKILQGDFRNWADIVIKIWRQKLIKYKVGFSNVSSTEKLYNSFVRHVVQEADGDMARISFLFKEYGIFVDMGVGKDTPYGNSGDVITKRKRKPWFSRSLYAEVQKLQEHLSKMLGSEAAKTIVMSLPEVIISSLGDSKAQRYKRSDSARNAANYQKQINKPIEERTWIKTKGNYTN